MPADHYALARMDLRRAAGILPRRGTPRDAAPSPMDAPTAALVLVVAGGPGDRERVRGEGLLTAAAEAWVAANDVERERKRR